MDSRQIIKKIMEKKEFSNLVVKDVELCLKQFDDEKYFDEEKVKLTRGLLKKVFSVFSSTKILSGKKRSVEWILKKHISTRERLKHYGKLYKKIFRDFKESNVKVYDLGAGVNGLSYNYFKEVGVNVDYVGIESIGQLVEIMNKYFEEEKKKGVAVQMSLFDLENLKKLIKKGKENKIVFLFKVIDSLEIVERNYSKKLLKEIVPLVDEVVVSFATKSLTSKREFFAQRKWLIEFIKEEFIIKKDFMFGGERYIIFRHKI